MSSQPYASTTFDTDTATLAIFDPAALAHRITDTADWWSIAEDALAEINAGNVLFVDLGRDGSHAVEIRRGIDAATDDALVARLRITSGCLYVGAGEQVPAGDLGPETVYGGVLLFAERGTCEVRLQRQGERLLLAYGATTLEATNHFDDGPRLP
ncbi:hypothetical protein IB239_00210 [Pseudomonas sp. PDM12]|jgi:hypothetical protein|uniref:DUF6386 family protein n=1 Tax=Pseudomonas sp. PDM12 TaxID=2769260 RepID=UPI00177FE987|nr:MULTISPECIES: DUF6386 family protein [unclassified Pseudomonas]MBD9653228.1 hypothetical protein [Pseudomonas sp. PDM12]